MDIYSYSFEFFQKDSNIDSAENRMILQEIEAFILLYLNLRIDDEVSPAEMLGIIAYCFEFSCI